MKRKRRVKDASKDVGQSNQRMEFLLGEKGKTKDREGLVRKREIQLHMWCFRRLSEIYAEW